jgi:outer membrane protein assembly factor BamA
MWLQLFAETSNGLGGTFSGNVYRADWRGYVALGKTVLALRWNEAYGQDQAEPFSLGGSFSDDLFTLPVLDQREFALRGYTNGTLTGHRARIGTVEWRTPLSDVDRHFMVPPVGLDRVSLNLFVDVGAAWEHDGQPDYHRGVGAELMTEVRIGYLIGIQARAGIARGVDEFGKTTAYLRVGRAF